MGAFSIWHLLIVVVVIAASAAPIFLASREKALERGRYAALSGGAVLLLVATALLPEPTGESAASASIALLLLAIAGLVASVLILLWSVHRLQDIGWSRWWALVLFVPFVNFVFWVALMVKRGSDRR